MNRAAPPPAPESAGGADPARNGDGDGIGDIAARTLLPDRARTDGGSPFIVGSDAGPHRPFPVPRVNLLFTPPV